MTATLYFADETGGEPAATAFAPGPATILIGPEGGFTPEEARRDPRRAHTPKPSRSARASSAPKPPRWPPSRRGWRWPGTGARRAFRHDTRTDLGESPLIESRDDLLSVFSGGEKPRENWRIGTEHEKFVYRCDDHRAPSWEEPGGIRDLLTGLTEFGWRPVEEGGKIIALSGPDGNVSLEPAGQFELSGAPLENLHQTCAEAARHLEQCKAVGDRLGLGFLGLGMWPDKRRDELPIMPKGRYEIMLRHMPRVGNLGLDMMLRTCTIQVNLDYASEADMVKKFRVGLALQPVATALFAHSPADRGQAQRLPRASAAISGKTPTRTAPACCRSCSRTASATSATATMRSTCRCISSSATANISTVAGQSFRDFLRGELPALPGEKPRLSDWIDHLSTAFPEVRLKSFLEMRGADGGRWGRICALPALWVGLLYDDAALDAAWDRVKHWTIDEREALRHAVPREALDARGPGRRDGARPCPRSARHRLGRPAPRAPSSTPRATMRAASSTRCAKSSPAGMTSADRLLDRYHGRMERRCQPHLRRNELLTRASGVIF